MSYILEALKKAQAERQLGHAPTLHAPSLQAGAADGGRAGLKKPMLLVLAAMAVVIVVLAVLLLRPSAPAVPAGSNVASGADAALAAADHRAAGTVPAESPSAPAQAPVAAPATDPAPVATGAPDTGAPAALPPPVAALPAPEASLQPPAQGARVPSEAGAPAPRRTADAEQLRPSAPTAGTAAAPAGAQTPGNVANGAAPVTRSPSEEPVLNLRELPEPIQRSIPQVTVGGYIYSKNPADRLLLVDKILRREGEEVAPGLLLEKLQPREAVFSYKGYRYRVPY